MSIAQDERHIPKNDFKFKTLSEAISAASYIEQVLSAEHQWITNRLSWLFVSQSFCITAYTILTTSTGVRSGADRQITVLRVGLPILGIICCATVGLAVLAASAVARRLANERGRLTRYINEESGLTIPLVGVDSGLRDNNIKWTHWSGALPQWLPWVLATLWLFLLLRIDFGV